MYEQSVYDSFAFVTLAERMRRRVVEEGLNPASAMNFFRKSSLRFLTIVQPLYSRLHYNKS